MSQLLKTGQKVRAAMSRIDCRIDALIGGGGQGEVYRVQMSDRLMALKWYFQHTATPSQRAGLAALIQKGSPSAHFLWPVELAEGGADLPGFGYLMLLRESRFRGIHDLLKRRVDTTFRSLATAGLNLATGFLQLHAKGLSYRDISHGNVFFDPKTGDILICDNDNVAVDGAASATVLGTPRFMAPEIVRGESLPNTQTDLFSLSVLLFYMLMLHHPLEGAREASIRVLDEPAMKLLYGDKPLFVFDPEDGSNGPVPSYQDNARIFWEIYPEFLKAMFTRAFTLGLHDPSNGRVRESEWQRAMARLRDEIVYCPACAAQNFAKLEPEEAKATRPTICWKCRAEVRLPMRLLLGKRQVLLNGDAKVYPHHLDPRAAFDYIRPVAEVSRHPQKPELWGLKNLGTETWAITASDGQTGVVEPERSAPMRPGSRIQFGKLEGIISTC